MGTRDNPAIVVDEDGVFPTRYYGLRAIASRFGVSSQTIFNWHIKEGFPLVLRAAPFKVSRKGVRHYTDETLIERWLAKMADQTRARSLRTRSARAETVRERCLRRGRKVPLEHATQADIESGNVQPNRYPPQVVDNKD